MNRLNESLTLPCGSVLSNRIAKSAMSENMARRFRPGREFQHAYQQWVRGGAGLLVSGNVMVDARHLGEANNVVIEQGRDNHEALRQWAAVAKGTDTQIWLQLNHPGKQSPKFLNRDPVAPSAVPLHKQAGAMFGTPRALTIAEIADIVQRFGYAAKVAKDTGFAGVQIHAAHGYLISQFLSPRHNIREDQYGGSIDNRMRFLVEIYEEMRRQVGPMFPIGIKINSADFSKGGFSNDEALAVAERLSSLGLDLLEISGGTYEAPAMMGKAKASTKAREAYFLEYTKEIRQRVRCPLMVTGGFRTRGFMEEVLTAGELDVIGLGRPLVVAPNFAKELLRGTDAACELKQLTTGFAQVDRLFPLEIIWYTFQIHRMGRKQQPAPQARVWPVVLRTALEVGVAGLQRTRA